MYKKFSTILFIFLMFQISVSTTAFRTEAEENSFRYEGEEMEIFQCNNSGTYIAQIDLEGSYVNFELDADTAPGIYKMKVYYAAFIEGVNTHTIFVNEEKAGQITYPKTESGWGTFSEDVFAEMEVTLKSGSNFIRFEKTGEDAGFAELDAILLTPVTLYTPDPASITSTPEPTAAKTPTPTLTAGITATAKSVIIDESDNGSFNYLYIIIPVCVLAAAVIIVIIIKKAK